MDFEEQLEEAAVIAQLRSRLIAVVATTLPPNPVDGQDCYLLVDATNYVVHHMKWVAAGNRWVYIGGADKTIAATDATAYACNGALVTKGAGFSVSVYCPNATSQVAIMAQFDANTADTSSNSQHGLFRDGAQFLIDAGANGFNDWLVGGAAAPAGAVAPNFMPTGTLAAPLGLPPINTSGPYVPHGLVAYYDEPGAGTHVYDLRHGGTGNGGNVRNRKLRAWVVP